MKFYRFIKIRGREGEITGHFVSRMYKLPFFWDEFDRVGFKFMKERLAGWTIWWVENEEDFIHAINKLDELKKTRIFEYKVMK